MAVDRDRPARLGHLAGGDGDGEADALRPLRHGVAHRVELDVSGAELVVGRRAGLVVGRVVGACVEHVVGLALDEAHAAGRRPGGVAPGDRAQARHERGGVEGGEDRRRGHVVALVAARLVEPGEEGLVHGARGHDVGVAGARARQGVEVGRARHRRAVGGEQAPRDHGGVGGARAQGEPRVGQERQPVGPDRRARPGLEAQAQRDAPAAVGRVGVHVDEVDRRGRVVAAHLGRGRQRGGIDAGVKAEEDRAVGAEATLPAAGGEGVQVLLHERVGAHVAGQVEAAVDAAAQVVREGQRVELRRRLAAARQLEEGRRGGAVGVGGGVGRAGRVGVRGPRVGAGGEEGEQDERRGAFDACDLHGLDRTKRETPDTPRPAPAPRVTHPALSRSM